MAIVVVKGRASRKDLKKAREDYKTYIKITLDLENETVALGGEYHADAEALLLEQGSKQKDIWGGGINLEEKRIETNAIINLRPGKNESPEILDERIRKKFIKIVKRVLKEYVQ